MSTDPRETIGNALSAFLTPEQITQLINEVLSINKQVSVEFHCKHCGKSQRQYGYVSDAKAVALALPDLLNQAYGRPSEANNTREPVIFTRLTKLEG